MPRSARIRVAVVWVLTNGCLSIEGCKMRKFLVSTCWAVVVFVSAAATQTAQADHGAHGGGYGGPNCHSSHHRSGYGGHQARYGTGYASHYGSGNIIQYQTALVPVYGGGFYQANSFGGSAFEGQPGFGVAGFPYGSPQYGVGYRGSSHYGNGYQTSLPRVQLRIGF